MTTTKNDEDKSDEDNKDKTVYIDVVNVEETRNKEHYFLMSNNITWVYRIRWSKCSVNTVEYKLN